MSRLPEWRFQPTHRFASVDPGHWPRFRCRSRNYVNGKGMIHLRDPNWLTNIIHSRVGEASVSSVGLVLEADDGDLLTAGLLLLAVLGLVLVVAGGLELVATLVVLGRCTSVVVSGLRSRECSRSCSCCRSKTSMASRGAAEVALRSVVRTSTVRSGDEVGSSRRSSVCWGWDVGVAQMCGKHAVDRQSEAHELEGYLHEN